MAALMFVNHGVSDVHTSLRDDSARILRAVAQAQGGDQDGLCFLYRRYAGEVFRCTRAIVKDHHEAEDLTQSVFAKLPTAIERYQPQEVPFLAWILRVARNMALDHLRARRAVPCEELRVHDEDCPWSRRERVGDLCHALASLPSEQRRVLVLRHVGGYSPGEIAAAAGRTESSIHGLHHRGRVALKAELERLGATPVISQQRRAA
jgi:RNA polymerase sigma-70 factor (ECF subfamily)